MSLPVSEAVQQASQIRVGHEHFGATYAEQQGARTKLSEKAETRALIYGLVVAAGSNGITGTEIKAQTGMDKCSISGRLNDLEFKDKLIFKTGETRTAEGGSPNNVYRCVPPDGRLL